MNTQDTTLPPPCGWPTMLKLFIEASATLIRQAQAAECKEHNYEQLLSAVQRVTDYGQQGLSALTKQAIAAQAPQPYQDAWTEPQILKALADADVSPSQLNRVVAGLLMKQAQQAQGVPASLQLGVAATKDGATVCLIQPHADGSMTVIHSGTHPIGDTGATVQLAAAPQAEPQPEREPIDCPRCGHHFSEELTQRIDGIGTKGGDKR